MKLNLSISTANVLRGYVPWQWTVTVQQLSKGCSAWPCDMTIWRSVAGLQNLHPPRRSNSERKINLRGSVRSATHQGCGKANAPRGDGAKKKSPPLKRTLGASGLIKHAFSEAPIL
jgi:hypothetical protein